MHRRRDAPKVLVGAFVWFAFSIQIATAAPLYIQSGDAGGVLGNKPAAISWTQTDTWSDVDITLVLYNQCGFFPEFCGGVGIPAVGNVYLTDSIGAGTTQIANEIAATALSTLAPGFQTLSAFSDLTLGPGTYYLVYSYVGLLGLGWGLSFAAPFVDLGPGVTAGPTFLYLGDLTGGYEPAEDPFFPIGETFPLFSITGTRTITPVPEPSLLLLIGGGVTAQLMRRRHARTV